MKNIAIDTDVIVASEIDNEPNHKDSKDFMEYILSNNLKEIYFFTSIFTFLELGSAMIRRTKDKDKAYSLLYQIRRSWKKIINPLPLSINKKQITVSKFSQDWIDELIETAIKFKTKSGDTIQTQAILENQIDCFITWNKRDFIGLENAIKGFKVFTPTEILSELNKINKKRARYSKVDNLIESISEKLKISTTEVEQMIQAKITKLSGLVSKEGATQIIASEVGLKLK
ncbi:MAG: hypothetical protein AABW80_01760 [Nanoarchaeota archaeon]